jgi:hypothetical protein
MEGRNEIQRGRTKKETKLIKETKKENRRY